MAKSRAKQLHKSTLREKLAEFHAKYPEATLEEVVEGYSKKTEYEYVILQKLYMEAQKIKPESAKVKRGAMIDFGLLTKFGEPKYELSKTKYDVYENYLKILEKKKVIENYSMSEYETGALGRFTVIVALVTFIPYKVIEYADKITNRKNNHWVDFDNENNQIIYGVKKCKVKGKLQVELCNMLFESFGNKLTSGEIIKKLQFDNDDFAKEIKKRSISDCLKQINRNVRSVLGVEELFGWENNKFWVKQIQ